MRYLKYILFAFIVSLNYLFFIFDFSIRNIIVIVFFYIIYYLINAFVLMNITKSKIIGEFLVLILLLGYLISSYSESIMLGLPLFFLIVQLYTQKYHSYLKIISSGILGLLLLSFLISTTVSPSISIKEENKIYNSGGDIAIISFSVDTGATGIDYKYKAQKEYLDGLLHIDKTLKSSNKYMEMQWINNKLFKIGDDVYKIWFP